MRPLRWSRAYWALGVAYVATIIYLTLMFNPPQGPDVPYADKWEHFLAYGVMMGWFAQLLQARSLRLKFALSFALLGGLLEILQGLGGVRHAEWADFAANATGVGLGLLFTWKSGGRALIALEKILATKE